MSFTNKTQHYELPQWTGEDKPTFLVDMNNAFSKIDEELYNAGANSDSAQQSAQGASQLAQSVNETLSETNAEVQRINGEVVTLKGANVTLENRVTELEGGSGSVSEQLTNLNEKAIINANDIKENQTSIAGLQGDMIVAKNDIDTIEGQLVSGTTKFQFGIDEKGNYGYIKAGADTVTPFKTSAEFKKVKSVSSQGNEVNTSVNEVINVGQVGIFSGAGSWNVSNAEARILNISGTANDVGDRTNQAKNTGLCIVLPTKETGAVSVSATIGGTTWTGGCYAIYDL